jgi:hypothetical protein
MEKPPGLCCKEGVIQHLQAEMGASPPAAGTGLCGAPASSYRQGGTAVAAKHPSNPLRFSAAAHFSIKSKFNLIKIVEVEAVPKLQFWNKLEVD